MPQSHEISTQPHQKTKHMQLASQLEECRWFYNHFLACRTRDSVGRTPGVVVLLRPDHRLCHSLKQDRQHTAPRAFASLAKRCRCVLIWPSKPSSAALKLEKHRAIPAFGGRGRYDSLTFPQYGNGCQMTYGALKLSKIGSLPRWSNIVHWKAHPRPAHIRRSFYQESGTSPSSARCRSTPPYQPQGKRSVLM